MIRSVGDNKLFLSGASVPAIYAGNDAEEAFKYHRLHRGGGG
jgi:hypothetical protein